METECLKWPSKAALFSPHDGKNPQRPSKYPVNNVINNEGIDFLTPVKQIHVDKLEAQNNLVINVFGWHNNCMIVHRISRKEAKVLCINLSRVVQSPIKLTQDY